MIEKYLPIGTVVLLKGGKKRVMVTGFACTPENKEKTFDYCGCLYPEGMLDSNSNLLFDHSQIEHVYYLGYTDAEEQQFKNRLKDILAKDVNENKAS